MGGQGEKKEKKKRREKKEVKQRRRKKEKKEKKKEKNHEQKVSCSRKTLQQIDNDYMPCGGHFTPRHEQHETQFDPSLA